MLQCSEKVPLSISMPFGSSCSHQACSTVYIMVQLINAGLVLFVQVTTEYADHPKSYLLTPSRKKVRKLVTRGSKITIVDQFFKDLQLRKHMAPKIGRIAQDEISVMCSNKFSSVLQNHSIHSFSCEGVLAEMEACAHTPLSILRMCTSAPKRPRKGKRQKHRQVPITLN